MYYGNNHMAGVTHCPAYGATCHNCSKRNHFAHQCRQCPEVNEGFRRTTHREQRNHFVDGPIAENQDSPRMEEDWYGIELVEACDSQRNIKWLVNLTLKPNKDYTQKNSALSVRLGLNLQRHNLWLLPQNNTTGSYGKNRRTNMLL